tara:strand:+ start:307 stop:564 length:258 start_codon:yes stop_codon:yes gene_type:complete
MKLISVASAIAVSGISLLSTSAEADTLYRYEGGGLYGGDAYQDSSGNYYNDNPIYGDGIYGGGVITDSEGNNYNCSNATGQCTPW